MSDLVGTQIVGFLMHRLKNILHQGQLFVTCMVTKSFDGENIKAMSRFAEVLWF